MNYWLVKSEPDTFSIEDLARAPRKTAAWDGVRNYQARNMLRDGMKRGDQAFFYYSSCDVPGIVGLVSVVKEGYPDKTAFQKAHVHFDAGSDPKNPRWYVVDVRLDRVFTRIVTLDELRAYAGGPLKNMVLLTKGSRLSVMPVTKSEWQFILALAS